MGCSLPYTCITQPISKISNIPFQNVTKNLEKHSNNLLFRTEAVQQQGLFASHWNDKLHSARTCGHLIKLIRYTPSRSRPNSISKNYLGQEELLGGCWRGDHPRRQQPRDHRPRGEPSEQKDLRWVVATIRLRHPCPHSSVSENSRRLGRFIHLTSVFQSVSETFSIHVHLIRGWPFHTKSSISDY